MIAPVLECSLVVQRGAFRLTAQVELAPGETVAIIGANGSGKSTLLGAIAGLYPLTEGEVRLNGHTLSSQLPGERQVSVSRAQRRIGLLDQRARLFPHLNARDNIAFGRRAQGARRSDADAQADEWLDRVGLAGRGKARVNELSGGQQQRIMIARTLASAPQLLLLDEPFSALDVTSRRELRELVAAESQRLGLPTILVTHDPVDLLAMADRVLVVEAGNISQQGSVNDVLDAPATPFAAAFAGRLLIRGTASEYGSLLLNDGPLGELVGNENLPSPGSAAAASIEPAAVRVTPVEFSEHADKAPPHATTPPSAINSWIGTIASVSSAPSGVRITCAEWPELYAEMTLSHALAPWLSVGSRVRWEVPPESVRFAAPQTP